MTLKDKIQMVDDLIRENEFATIKDFADILKEVQGIELKTFYEIPILNLDTGHD